MEFTRGLDPKAAMNVGLERCNHCHTILNNENHGAFFIDTTLCNKCFEKEYLNQDYHDNVWDRLTTFGKFVVVVMGLTMAGSVIWWTFIV